MRCVLSPAAGFLLFIASVAFPSSVPALYQSVLQHEHLGKEILRTFSRALGIVVLLEGDVAGVDEVDTTAADDATLFVLDDAGASLFLGGDGETAAVAASPFEAEPFPPGNTTTISSSFACDSIISMSPAVISVRG